MASSEQPDQTREQLADCLRGQGVEPRGQMLMLLLALLELDRLICSGRRLEGAHTYAAFADRVPSSRRLDRDEALAELALRYFAGHGPATERDLAYWATLTLSDVRRGLTQVRDRLASFDHDGRTFWLAPDDPPPAGRGAPTGHLLQILDEVYRGYQDSRMVLDSEGIAPSGRETAIGMALVDAQMVARMKRTIGRRVAFEITPYNGALKPSHRKSWSRRPHGTQTSSASNTSCACAEPRFSTLDDGAGQRRAESGCPCCRAAASEASQLAWGPVGGSITQRTRPGRERLITSNAFV